MDELLGGEQTLSPAAAALRSLVYFRALDHQTLDALAGRAIRRSFGPNETIFFEGEPATGMWIIASGSVKIFKLNPDGAEHVLRLLGDGNSFNDIPAFDNGPNPASAATLSDAVLWVLPSEALQDAMHADGQFALTVIGALTSRVRALARQIEDLSLYSVIVRLARFLLKQASDPSLSGPGVTRTAIAAHLATTPQTISLSLRQLEAAGAIEFDRHRILIRREDVLRAIAMQ